VFFVRWAQIDLLAFLPYMAKSMFTYAVSASVNSVNKSWRYITKHCSAGVELGSMLGLEDKQTCVIYNDQKLPDVDTQL